MTSSQRNRSLEGVRDGAPHDASTDRRCPRKTSRNTDQYGLPNAPILTPIQSHGPVNKNATTPDDRQLFIENPVFTASNLRFGGLFGITPRASRRKQTT
jgi:hypothetical protein